MVSNSKRKKQGVKRVDTPPYLLIPFLLVICLVPLIVYLKVIPLGNTVLEAWTGQSSNLDFFSYYKAWTLVFLAAILGLGLLCLVFSRRYRLVPARTKYILLGAYAMLAGLSTLLSDNRSIALRGFIDRYEGIWVILAYCLVMFAGVNIVQSEKAFRTVLIGLLISATLMSVLGLGQFFGQDFLASTMGRKLILPERYEANADKVRFNFGEGTIYGTLYNTNYVGSYMVLIIPIALALLSATKDRKQKMIWGSASLLCTLTLLGSNSRAGYVAAFAVTLVFAGLRWRSLIKHWKLSLIMIACAIFALVAVNTVSSGRLFDRFGSMIAELDPTREPSLQTVEVDGGSARLVYREEVLQVSVVDGGLGFSDADGQCLRLKPGEDGKLCFVDERYAEFSVQASNGIIQIARNMSVLRFGLDDEGLYLADRTGGRVSVEPVETWGFEGRETLGSSRGYIWSRTIPLIRKTLLIGHGPDTFAFHFPQHDYLGKARFLGDMGRIVDKPHNMYLQTAVQTGLVSLLAVLGIVGLYAVDSLRLYAGKPVSGLLRTGGLACFLAVVGYMTAGVFNDSVVSVAPVFWGMLGVGIGVNQLVKTEIMRK